MTLLEQLRNKMTLRSEYVAGLLDCTPMEYQQIESGITQPTPEQSYMLQRIFIIPTDQLLSGVTLTHDEQQIQNFLAFQQLLR